MTNQTINLNMIPGGVMPRVYASQFDNQTDALTFNLYNGDSVFTIPAGAGVLINGTKPDRTGFSYSAATWSASTVVCNVTTQMTACAGIIPCELRIRTETQIIGSLNFQLVVEKSALSDDGVISETELPLIEQAIEISSDIAGYVETAQNAATTATAAASTATDAATRSETINVNVEGIYDDLTDATSAANTAATAANTAAASLSNLSATAVTLAEGASATASYNSTNKTFTFGIPRGATGASGVITELAGFFTMYVDEEGYLWAVSQTDLSDKFYYDNDTGVLYFVTDDGGNNNG